MQMEEKEPDKPILIDTLPEVVDDQVIYSRDLQNYPFSNLEGTIDLAVLLPFYLSENVRRTEIDSARIMKGRKDYRNISRSEDWIYPASIEFIEMYEGILMAADTLRSIGLEYQTFMPSTLKVIPLK